MAIDFDPILPAGSTPDDSLLPPIQTYDLPAGSKNSERKYQGIPALERTKKGKMLCACYTGGEDEGVGNYVILFQSKKEFAERPEPFYAVMPEKPQSVRVFDPCLWMAPDNRLWLFVAQGYAYYDGRIGVWASVCDDPDAEIPQFSPMRRIANGIMMNKPIVVDGNWLLPCAIWDKFQSNYNHIPKERFSNVYISRDDGKTFAFLSHADDPERKIDEHMIAELSDGRLMMLIREKKGIGVSYSADRGNSWSDVQSEYQPGPCSRFCFKRLKSGRLLLVNHYHFDKRNNLTAMLSDDDGKTWMGFLLLDGRQDVSYPDAVEDESGNIYMIYDRDRYKEKELLLAKVTEKDILAGRVLNPSSYLAKVIVKAEGKK